MLATGEKFERTKKMAIQNESVNGGDTTREKMMKIINTGDKKVYLVAQELQLAKLLADNNKTVRDRALKRLKVWFKHRSEAIPLTESDFQKIWKGLFYCMWMSDKPLIQEECAENISNLIHFPSVTDSLLFFKAGMEILINEWNGIDQLRLDKFLMLVRRMLRHILLDLKKHGLKNKENIDSFNDILSQSILSKHNVVPLGLFMHFTEIFLEELAKVTEGKIHADRVVSLLHPFIKKLAITDNHIQVSHIQKHIFNYLMRQSNLGLEYDAKYKAWKEAGFPGSINSMQKVKPDAGDQTDSDEENSGNATKEKVLDPRAGRVDVELPQIPFNAKALAAALNKHKFDKDTTSKSRHLLGLLAGQFTKFSNGVYPLGITKLLKNENDNYDTNIRKAAKRLIKFENKLLGKNKKRKRSSDNDAGSAEVEEKRSKIENKKAKSKQVTNNKEEMEEELAKFIEKSEANIMKKKAKDDDKKLTNNKKVGIEKNKGKLTNDKKIKTKVTNNKVEEGLGSFIEKSEEKRKRKIKNGIHKKNTKKTDKAKNTQTIIDNIECVFERNSGTWVVFDVSRDKGENEVPSQQTGCPKQSLGVPSKTKESPSTSSESQSSSDKIAESPSKSSEAPSEPLGNSKGSPDKRKYSPVRINEQNGSPRSGLNPVKLFETPQKETDLFPKSEWDEPLQEGEYEICIPSKKHVGKMKKLAKKRNQSLHELINTTEKTKVKSRLSLDCRLVRNSFSTPSMKKVKINTKLNVSQEVHEHHAQVLSSPGIPYDANKRPAKPLLKTPVSSTPINPFYNKQLDFD